MSTKRIKNHWFYVSFHLIHVSLLLILTTQFEVHLIRHEIRNFLNETTQFITFVKSDPLAFYDPGKLFKTDETFVT